MPILSLSFFVAATLYSMVGFGGGSTYIALLGLYGVSTTTLPIVALLCNILVVSFNIHRYRRGINPQWSIVFPLTITSVPAAYWAGHQVIPEVLFLRFFAITLFCASLAMVIRPAGTSHKPMKLWQALMLGGLLGFISGLVGIGGGIFLAPILYFWNVGNSQQISLYTSSFILVNSCAGLLGQLQKHQTIDSLWEYWGLFVAVLVGGWLGPTLHLRWCTPLMLRRFTAVLILMVSIKLGISGWH